MIPHINNKTRNQLVAVILIDCITKCNAMQVPQDEYERQLKAILRERLGETGQKEFAL